MDMSTLHTPLITIGIPTYNRPEGLANTLQRATQQTYKNLEILISDNASIDEQAVRAVVDAYKADPRVRYIRQPVNIGSTGNFPFLAREAKGEYFLWMSDDDDVELGYVQALVDKLSQNPTVAIVMGGYDVEDRMSNPVIRLNLTEHLHALQGTTAYERLKAYILQPDHLGKSRLNWGLFPTPLIQKAFRDCFKHLGSQQTAQWADLPIDMRMLSYGDLAVVDTVVWHVNLLPTSDGRSQLVGAFRKLKEMSARTQISLSAVVKDSDLTTPQKVELLGILRRRARKEKLQLFIYYQMIGRSPRLARWIKKLWYHLFS